MAMSEWYNPKDDDIDISVDGTEVDIYVTHNEYGNIYITLTDAQIDHLHSKLVEAKAK